MVAIFYLTASRTARYLILMSLTFCNPPTLLVHGIDPRLSGLILIGSELIVSNFIRTICSHFNFLIKYAGALISGSDVDSAVDDCSLEVQITVPLFSVINIPVRERRLEISLAQ